MLANEERTTSFGTKRLLQVADAALQTPPAPVSALSAEDVGPSIAIQVPHADQDPAGSISHTTEILRSDKLFGERSLREGGLNGESTHQSCARHKGKK